MKFEFIKAIQMIIHNVHKLFRKVSVIWLMLLDSSLKGRGATACNISSMKHAKR